MKGLCPLKLRNTYLYLCHSIKYCLVTGLMTLSSTVFIFLPDLCTPQCFVSSSMASRKYPFNYWMNEFTAKCFHGSFSVLCNTPKRDSILQEMVHFFCFSNATKILSDLVTNDPPLTVENQNLYYLGIKMSDLILSAKETP